MLFEELQTTDPGPSAGNPAAKTQVGDEVSVGAMLLHSALDSLLGGRMEDLSNTGLDGVVHALQEALVRQMAAWHRAVLEVEERGMARESGARNTSAYLQEELTLSAREAGQALRVARATRCGPYTATGGALESGACSPAKAQVILTMLGGLPAHIDDDTRLRVELRLLDQARLVNRPTLDRIAATIRAEIIAIEANTGTDQNDEDGENDHHERDRGAGNSDAASGRSGPDGADSDNADSDTANTGSGSQRHDGAGADSSMSDNPNHDCPHPQESDPAKARRFTFSDTPYGTTRIFGELDAEGAALLRTALDSLAAPAPAEDGSQDSRPPARRRGDALVELARRVLTCGAVPISGGVRPHLDVIVPLGTLLRGGTQPAKTSWGLPLSRGTLSRLMCDAQVSRIITDPAGVPLDVGRNERTAPPRIRRALAIRDQGCAFPGCDMPVSWCECHHVTPWELGGTTSLDTMVLLCSGHRHQVHRENWEITFGDDRRPSFTPPRRIDPTRTPRRNAYSQPGFDHFDPGGRPWS